MPACSVEGCDARVNARGLCSTHYGRYKRSDEIEDFPKKGRKPREKKTQVRDRTKEARWTNSFSAREIEGMVAFFRALDLGQRPRQILSVRKKFQKMKDRNDARSTQGEAGRGA